MFDLSDSIDAITITVRIPGVTNYLASRIFGPSLPMLQVYKLPDDRLYVTYFGGDEASGLGPGRLGLAGKNLPKKNT